MGIAGNIRMLKQHLPTGITLVAVSKNKPVAEIMEAYNTGQRIFGENYVNELVEKHTLLPKDIEWHFIGHLQSNKVKFIAPFVHLVQGVDSFKLLKEINKQGQKSKRVINCLLQVHIAVEETKFGLSEGELKELILSEELKKMQHVSISGLMGMASNTPDKSLIRKEFLHLNMLAAFLKGHISHATILSMGMTSDYKEAIACGSNLVRIGSAIFGERVYSN